MPADVAVMVTGVGGGGHGEQIIKALRLSTIRYTIIGADTSPMSKGLMEVDDAYVLPPASDPDYVPCVLAVCQRHAVRALFHGSEAELRVLSRERARIAAAGIFLPINPEHVIDLCMDKGKTMRFLSQHGFSVPRWVTVSSREDLEGIDFLPAVLKPSVGGGGSTHVLLAQTRDELIAFADYLLRICPEFIVQEYVGAAEDEYTAGVLLSMDGEVLNSIAVRRMILSSLSNRTKVANRTGNGSFGSVLAISNGVSQGEVGRFPAVTQPCEEIASALGCRGTVNVQCRLVGGKVVVFEINPRFSGTTSLRAMVGYNEPDLLIRRYCLGEDVPSRFPYRSAVILRGLQETVVETRGICRAVELL